MWTQLPKPYVPDVYRTDTKNLRITLSTTTTPGVYTVAMTSDVFPDRTVDVTAKDLDDAKEKAIIEGLRLTNDYRKEIRRQSSTPSGPRPTDVPDE